MEPNDFMNRGYLLPKGSKDLTEVWKFQSKQPSPQVWRDRLPECFGIDLRFGRHPAQAASAIEMFYDARHSGVSSGEIISAIHDYLVSKGAQQKHVDEETEYVRKLVA